jgi:2-polyprenyl-3-methyl-5-hydroxy-6-metoxy-1,4-benzoquinol methylase
MLSTDNGLPSARLWTPTLTEPACRLCGARLNRTLIDFGHLPLGNRTIAADAPNDQSYRLHARICDNCTLVQVADVGAPETIAAPRLYLSTRFATSLNKAKRNAEAMRKRHRLGAESLVIEVGSYDGTRLRHFQAAGIQVLGIESSPTAVSAATEIGIPTVVGLFNTETAMEIAVRHGCADLVLANDVLPHAPDLFDFAAGLASILRPNGVLIVQVPHLLSLVQKMQFDAFRHDSYTYLSLRVLEHVLRSVGLRVFDAEQVPDHGGSLRAHACHVIAPHAARPGLKSVRLAEGFGEREQPDFYAGFSDRVAEARAEIQKFLRTRRVAGRRVAAYGVATRGNTLLNWCGITTDEIACVADPDPAKHGRLLPGSRIPIVPVEVLMDDPPDDVVILPWPNAAEAALELLPLRRRGTQLWTPVPRIARA